MGKLSTRAKEWKPSAGAGGGLAATGATTTTTPNVGGGGPRYDYSSVASTNVTGGQTSVVYTGGRGQNTIKVQNSAHAGAAAAAGGGTASSSNDFHRGGVTSTTGRSLHAPIYTGEYSRPPNTSDDTSLSMTATASEWTSSSWVWNESSNKNIQSVEAGNNKTTISSQVNRSFKNNTFNIHAPNWSPTRRNQGTQESFPSFASQQTESSSQSISTAVAAAAASQQPTWQPPSTVLEGDVSQEPYPVATQTTEPVETTAVESKPATLPRGNMPNPPWGTVRSNNTLTQPQYKNIHSYGLPNHTLWSLYRSIAMDCTREMDPHDARYKAIPPNFTNAMPLEQIDRVSNVGSKIASMSNTNTNAMNHDVSSTRSSFGYHSSIFRVTNQEDGRVYCLRRFDHVRGVNQKIASTVTNAWTRAVMHRSSSRTSPSDFSSSQGGRMMMTMSGRGVGGGAVGGGSSGRGDPTRRRLLEHPGLVRFYKCFYVVSNRAVFFLHEYHPMSLTLRECVYGMEKGGMMGGWTGERALTPGAFRPLEEEVIWSYVTQLVSAVRVVHRANMACRTLQLHHILVCPDAGSGMDETAAQMMMMSTGMGSDEGFTLRTNRVRLRINCLGIVDALEFEARKTVQELQMEDMKCLGRIILSLASGTEVRGNASDELYNQCQEFMQQNYSLELYKLTVSLLARPRPGRMGMMIVDPPNIDEVCRVIADHALDEMDSAHVIIDGMDQALAAEYESGRVLRLMMKLAFINERPEFGVDPRWSESGDCYVLKLFRDYVFHQADESGRPIMDLGHIISTLNKLDAAEEEQIVLTSRDGKTIMVVKYADISRYLENAYAELCNSSVSMQQVSDRMGGL